MTKMSQATTKFLCLNCNCSFKEWKIINIGKNQKHVCVLCGISKDCNQYEIEKENNMIDEFELVDQGIETLLQQSEDIKTMIANYNAPAIVEYFSKTHNLYNSIPLIIHFARELDKDYWNKKSAILQPIAEVLTEDIKSIVGDGYTVEFVNIRNMTYGIFNDEGVVLCRFSLINKNYQLMKWSVTTEEGYLKRMANSKKNIEHYEEVMKLDEEKIEEYQKFVENYFLFFKEIRNFKNFYDVVFNSKRIKKNLESMITTKQLQVKSSQDIVDKEQEMQDNLALQKEESKIIIEDLVFYFSEFNYKREDEENYSGFYF